MTHNQVADRGVRRKSDKLEGKTIGLGICGSIGAVEVVKMIRELRRHGAHVFPYITPAVERFISRLSIEWAAEHAVIDGSGPEVDHLASHDLVLVAPATLNTIAKCALGLSDNAVTLLVASQLGRKGKLIFVPAMNGILQKHPLYPSHVSALKEWGAQFFDQPTDEDRQKMPAAEDLVSSILERFT